MSSGDNYVVDGPAMIGWNKSIRRLEASLPHQCDKWIIGDVDHVRVMIADLTALVPEFEHPEKYRHEHVCFQCKKEFIEAGGSCSSSCSGHWSKGLCQKCWAADWTKTAIRNAAERKRLRSLPEAGRA